MAFLKPCCGFMFMILFSSYVITLSVADRSSLFSKFPSYWGGGGDDSNEGNGGFGGGGGGGGGDSDEGNGGFGGGGGGGDSNEGNGGFGGGGGGGDSNEGNGGFGSGGGGGGYSSIFPGFYENSCPQVDDIVMSVLQQAISRQPRTAAALLRLHFHDCFVQGCDASILLDDSSTITSEKSSNANRNSIRGFEVIDQIKAKLEQACPQTVSCADIVALAARDSVVLSGGPNWEVPLGRRDSRTASLSASNNNIPPPNSTLQNLIALFNRQGLGEVDLVALSGSHTIGVARCVSFKQRLYNQNGNNQPDQTLEINYFNNLKSVCPRSGGDNIISPLDYSSPTKFDNAYFQLIVLGKGLLNSDQVLLTQNTRTMQLVQSYADDASLFFDDFASSMVKMGNISPLTGYNGEVRKNCRAIN